jgi:hypothetical protein
MDNNLIPTDADHHLRNVIEQLREDILAAQASADEYRHLAVELALENRRLRDQPGIKMIPYTKWEHGTASIPPQAVS